MIYFGEEPDPAPAPCVGGAAADAVGLRDPATGECRWLGDGPCDEAPPLPPDPDWASCTGPCEGQDEPTCLADPSCRAAYDEPDDGQPPRFRECWGVAPSGPVPATTACGSLGAHECSQRNDCAAVYAPRDAGGGAPAGAILFAWCQPEDGVGLCGDLACAAGYTCQWWPDPPAGDRRLDASGESARPVCVPDEPRLCATIDCGGHCIEWCDASGCHAACEPIDPGCPPGTGFAQICDANSCDDTSPPQCDWDCVDACVPLETTCADLSCEGGSHCEVVCPPCDPQLDGCPDCAAVCVPEGGGLPCAPPLDAAYCAAEPPACGSGYVAEAGWGCWTGTCIPAEVCATCAERASEAACVEAANEGCWPSYAGFDCTCDASGGCACASVEFAACRGPT